MLDRSIAIALLWGMRLSLVWLVAHEYLAFVDEKLTVISRALSTL
ncbi:MAG: hypothetical protein ABWX81_06655 [Pseudolabrys sp.]